MSYVVGSELKSGGRMYLFGRTPSGCPALDWTSDPLCARKMTRDEADRAVLKLGQMGYEAKAELVKRE